MSTVKIGYIKDILLSEKMNVKLLSQSNLINFQHLEIDLGLDDKQRSLIANLWLDNQEKNNKQYEVAFLQFLIVLPYTFADEVISELSRYLLVINKSIAFPGFGLSEPDRSIYYKYTLNLPNSKISPSFLIDFIGLVWLIHDAFSPKIEEVAIGNKSLIEIVNE